MFRFIKKCFFIGSLFLSNLVSTSLNVVFQLIIKYVKQDHKLSILTVIIPYFILLVLKQINVVTIVIIFMIDIQNCVFLML